MMLSNTSFVSRASAKLRPVDPWGMTSKLQFVMVTMLRMMMVTMFKMIMVTMFKMVMVCCTVSITFSSPLSK